MKDERRGKRGEEDRTIDGVKGIRATRDQRVRFGIGSEREM